MKQKTILSATIALFACAATLQANATDYYWVGGEIGTWNESVAAWATEVNGTGEAHKFTTSDKAIFTADAAVTVSVNVNIKSLEVQGATLTLSGSNMLIFQSNGTISASDGGKIILDNNTLRAAKGTTTISAPIEIGSAGGKFLCTRGDNGGGFSMTSALTGSGDLTVCCTAGSNGSTVGSFTFSGDASAYTGKATIKIDNDSVSQNQFSASLASADWSAATVDYFYSADSGKVPSNAGNYPFTAETTYKFGSLFATIPPSGSGAYTFSIGEDKSTDSALQGDWGANATVNITFASTGMLTHNCANTASITVTNGGTVRFPSAAGVPTTLDFKESGVVQIAYDEEILDAVNAAVAHSTVQPTIKYAGTVSLTAGDKVENCTFADGVTIAIMTAKDTKNNDILATLTDCTFEGGGTYEIRSPYTGASTPFWANTANSIVSTSGNVRTIKAIYSPGVYVWNGASGANFGDAANWLKGNTSTAATDAPNNSTTCIIPENATIKAGKYNCGSLFLLGDLTYTESGKSDYGDNNLNIGASKTVEGPGKFIASGANIRCSQSGTVDFYSDLEVAEDMCFFVHNKGYLNLRGALSGTGKITFNDSNNANNPGCYLTIYGDCSQFTGTIETPSSSDKVSNKPTFNSDDSYIAFSNEVLNFGGTLVVNRSKASQPLCVVAGTYTFGSISGNVYGGSAAVKIVTKATAETEIAYTAGAGSWTLENAGSAAVTVTGSNFAGYVASGTGAFKLSSTLAQAATLTKVGSKTNAKCPALVIEESDVDLTGLKLALEVPDEVSGWQYLVQATSFSGDATALPTYTQPAGRDKYNLKMMDATVLGATDATGFVIIIAEGATDTEISDGNLETWLYCSLWGMAARRGI